MRTRIFAAVPFFSIVLSACAAAPPGAPSVPGAAYGPAAPAPVPSGALEPAAGIDVRAAEAAAPPGAPVVTIDATSISRPRSEIHVAPPSSIQAGEWDDNANFREFQTWLSNEHLGQHLVDVEVRRFLVVRDVNGRAVPRCRVRVHDS